jgi:murein DD-endopeptidase MepM/ murein hydrolase activator NlpD
MAWVFWTRRTDRSAAPSLHPMARQPHHSPLALSALLVLPLAASPPLALSLAASPTGNPSLAAPIQPGQPDAASAAAEPLLAQALPEAGQAPGPAASPDLAPPPAPERAPQPEPTVRELPAAAPAPAMPAPAAQAGPPAVEPPRTPPAAVRQQPAPAALVAPDEPSGTGTTIRPGLAERQPQPPRRFDQSLDALIRDGVVSPREVKVRVHPGLIANPSLLRQGCGSGAFSARECGAIAGDGGMVFRQRGGGSAQATGAIDFGGGGGGGGERYGIDAAPLPPIAVPVTALLSGIGGSFRLTDVFRVTPRPQAIGGNGNRGLIFPLIGAAEPTSGFGWRLHPILGTWLMHSGRDLAAPEGTPVVAALSGRVVSSGDAGGYGLAVEIEHERPLRRTLYGHLSELYVKEGDRVRQGEVIGRVGSTGRSTGPHLHFEVRMPQEGGWVAIDPGEFDTSNPRKAGGLPGLAGLRGGGADGGPPPDAVALLLGQLIESLERPRSPLGPIAAPGSGKPGAAGAATPGTAAGAPLPTDRLPRPFPPAANVPPPAPLPRQQGGAGATAGG